MNESVLSAVKHWWVSLLLGIVFVAAGIWVAMTPLSSYVALSIFFSAAIFVL